MYRRIWGPTTTSIHAGRAFREGKGLDQDNLHEVSAIVTALEHGEGACLTCSHAAALETVFESFLKPTDHLIAPADVTISTERLLAHWVSQRGLQVTRIQNTLDLAQWEAALQPGTAMVFLETPSFHTLSITDLAAVARLAKSRGIRTVADNTHASPMLTKPCGLGIDVSISGSGCYSGGASDQNLGLIIGGKDDISRCEAFVQLHGTYPHSFKGWLLQRDLKTLYMRVRRACDNANSLAQWLFWQPSVSGVNYPGLSAHPGYGVAQTQMQGCFGVCLNFEIKGDVSAGVRFCQALEIMVPGLGQGGMETMIYHPASMGDLKERDVSPGLLRLFVGIEDETDLIADLERGLQAATIGA